MVPSIEIWVVDQAEQNRDNPQPKQFKVTKDFFKSGGMLRQKLFFCWFIVYFDFVQLNQRAKDEH